MSKKEAVSRSNFHKIKQFLQYKCGDVRFVGRFYPSSKTCSACGRVKEMPLHFRTYECECGLRLNKYLNTTINLVRAGCPEFKPVETKALAAGNSSETVVCETGNQLKGAKGHHSSFTNRNKYPLMSCKPVVARLLLKEDIERRKAHSSMKQAVMVPCA